jgi:hypothetical protein
MERLKRIFRGVWARAPTAELSEKNGEELENMEKHGL